MRGRGDDDGDVAEGAAVVGQDRDGGGGVFVERCHVVGRDRGREQAHVADRGGAAHVVDGGAKADQVERQGDGVAGHSTCSIRQQAAQVDGVRGAAVGVAEFLQSGVAAGALHQGTSGIALGVDQGVGAGGIDGAEQALAGDGIQ